MAELTTLTYTVSGGNATVAINADGKPVDASKVSMQVKGDASVNGAVTVKLQESNEHSAGQKDITGATAVADVNTNEFVPAKDVSGAYLNYDIAVGTATLGTITIILNYK
jgi:hypothetical protein